MTTQNKGWHIAKVQDIPPGQPGFMSGWHSVRKHFGITAFGINAVTKNEGEVPVPEHTESDQEEIFFVSEGRALFSLDSEEFVVEAGTFIFAQPQVKRGAKALASPTTILIIGAQAGGHVIADWDN